MQFKSQIFLEGKNSANQDAAKYSDTFEQLVDENNCIPDQNYSAYNTEIFLRTLPTSTLTGAGETKASRLKQNKDRLTVPACADTASTHKIKLLVIGKYNCFRAFKGISHLQVACKAQESAWVNKEIFLERFTSVFITPIKNNLRKIGKPQNY
jgi:hypothetical protein